MTRSRARPFGAVRRRRAVARLAALGLPVEGGPSAVTSLAAPACAVLGGAFVLVLHDRLMVAVVAGLAVATLARVGLGAMLGRQLAADRAAVLLRELPVALDLVGACLAAGASVADALCEVGGALDGELARALADVGRSLRRGVPDVRAWAALDVPQAPPPLVALARAAVRSAATGSALEPWIAELAGQVRAEQEADALRSAHRAGVLAVLPLGLCALPAYVLLAVVPAVAGLLRHLR